MKQALLSLPGNYSYGKMNSKIQYRITNTMEKCKRHVSSGMLSDFSGPIALTEEISLLKYPSPIKDMIRVILTPTLHSGSMASSILIAPINASFIKCLLSIYQYGCQFKTKHMSSVLLTFANPSLPIPYKRGRHNRIS